ncbi:toll/interleukin-1 receptor domain-containing protein [Streptomyces sp. NBC_00191]|uniref:toll/interleukin-1 receptor domain-containing protein n=1 Tax=Streptomyces sp. NBC_00191 TaxID=2975674 RepID=UPI003870922A
MRYFVSYARRDNNSDRLRDIKGLFLACGAGSIYIDDLERHGITVDRVQAVVEALQRAEVFCAVYSDNYLRTEWTRWEFNIAVTNKMEIIALLPDGSFVRPGSPQWPWSFDGRSQEQERLAPVPRPPQTRVLDVCLASEGSGCLAGCGC